MAKPKVKFTPLESLGNWDDDKASEVYVDDRHVGSITAHRGTESLLGPVVTLSYAFEGEEIDNDEDDVTYEVRVARGTVPARTALSQVKAWVRKHYEEGREC